MKMLYAFRQLSLFILAIMSFSGCMGCQSAQVPGGHIGLVRTPSGFEDTIRSPGNEFLFGRDTMYLLEVADHQETIHMNVLCTNQVNFQFDIGALVAIDRNNTAKIKEMIQNLTPAGMVDGMPAITIKQLFEMYAKPTIDQEARRVISKYASDQIIANRPHIIDEVRASVHKAMTGAVITVKNVTVNNDDYPKMITEAQEKKVTKQIEIETEKAEQQRRLVEANNQLTMAEVRYKQHLVEAAQIADANTLIGSSITTEYLAWFQLKMLGEAAHGPNNWGFIPYTDFVGSALKNRTSTQGLVDAELMARVQKARAEAGKTPAHATTPPSAPIAAPPAVAPSE